MSTLNEKGESFEIPITLIARCIRNYGWNAEFTTKAMVGYRQFIKLKLQQQDWHDTVLSPSLTVDLVWRQHILDVEHYVQACQQYAGQLIGHNPNSNGNNLHSKEERFQTTKLALKTLFGCTFDAEVWGFAMETEPQQQQEESNLVVRQQQQQEDSISPMPPLQPSFPPMGSLVATATSSNKKTNRTQELSKAQDDTMEKETTATEAAVKEETDLPGETTTSGTTSSMEESSGGPPKKRRMSNEGEEASTGKGLRLLPKNFSPSQNEVIIGRGRWVANHIGNQRFQDLIISHLQEYSLAKTKGSKSAIILRVLTAVKQGSPDEVGGFVKQDVSTKRWYAMEESSARISTAQAFRDALSGNYRSSKQYKQQRRHSNKQQTPRASGPAVPTVSVPAVQVPPSAFGATLNGSWRA